jgi:L-histidine Nalpha-methyltransferase
VIENFKSDVIKGLSGLPKSLPSKYFYDEEGSRIFQEIMNLPEYYLSQCENEIFEHQGLDIIRAFVNGAPRIRIIDLGAGDGIKTKLLIQACYKLGIEPVYTPIDISAEAIRVVRENMKDEFPELEIDAVCADYYQALDQLENNKDEMPKLILFLGSNIGNYSDAESILFLNELSSRCHIQDALLVGFDLQKDPRVILAAYNDSQKVTKRFNLNLLQRMNRELGADFNVEKFDHYENYDPIEGSAKSYIISNCDQLVRFKEIDQEFQFSQGESVYVEMSRKYDFDDIAHFANMTGFNQPRHFTDRKIYFSDSLFKKIGLRK